MKLNLSPTAAANKRVQIKRYKHKQNGNKGGRKKHS